MRLYAVISGVCCALALNAQNNAPKATLQPDAIRIGEQAQVVVEFSYRVDDGRVRNVEWPVIGDTLTAQVEIVAATALDTLVPNTQTDPYLHVQRRSFTITAWDTGYWAIPPFVLTVNGEALPSNALLLAVSSVPVDTTRAFRDIHDIATIPLTWRDLLRQYGPWVGGALLAILSALLLARWLRKRARTPKTVAPPPPAIPLHDRTIAALQAIAARQLWQNGHTKEYHSAITDLLRAYVEERFGITAMERTSDELVAAMRTGPVPAEARDRLENMLRLADMVKFAKYHALPAENGGLMDSAIAFVERTRPEEHGQQAG